MRTIAKIKFDVKGVESKTERNVPKPGVYPCKIVSCVDAKPSGKDRRLEVQYEITSGEYKGSKLFDYINLESEASRWKLRQFLEAVGIVSGKKESGTLDPNDIVGTALSVRTRLENSEQYGASAKPATLMPLDADEDEEDDEDLTDDTEAEPDDEDEDDSGDDLTWSDLEEMDFDELCELVEEEELEVETHKGKGKKKKPRDEDELRAEIAEELEIEHGDEDDEDDEEYDRDDLEAMDKEELAEAAEKLEVEFPDGKLTAKRKKAVIDAILEAQDGDDEDDEDDEDEEDEEDETPDYASMSPTELKALCKERELDTKGTKKVLIARLKKDDKPF